MRAVARAAPLLLALLPVVARADSPPPNLLRNGGFSEWKDGAPVDWQVAEGSRTGDGPVSSVSKLEGGGVRLAGNATTGRWQMLVQPRPMPAGVTCRLSYQARLSDARLDPGQRENRYVGVRLGPAPLAGAKPPRFVVDGVLRDVWTTGEVVFRSDGGAVDVVAFLSTSGALEVREVFLEVVQPERSFAVLAQNMARYYSYFPQRGVNWAAHTASHQAAFAAATDEASFLGAAKALLAPLKDTHVWLRDSKGALIPTWVSDAPLNIDGKRLLGALPSPRMVGRVGIVAELEPQLGYLAVTSLQGTEVEHTQLETALEGLLTKRGLILDLRGNGGGNEVHAHKLVGRLMDEPRLYARRRFRSGEAATDFGPWQEAWIRPLGEGRFTGPIVVLTGPGCVSSGEGMAKMLRARPNTRFVGQPTRGASGHPQPVPLPNGVEVWFSRWQDALPDGTQTEGRGVTPDVEVPGTGPGDMTLMRGTVELGQMLAPPR
jgi:hypothetical protein